MAVEVILPRVDMDMATGKISKWHAKDGEKVTKGAAAVRDRNRQGGDGNRCAGRRHPAQHPRRRGRKSRQWVRAVAFIYAEGEAVQSHAPAAVIAPVTASAAALIAQASTVTSAVTTVTGHAPRRWHGGWRRQAALALGSIAGSGPRGRIVADDVRKTIEAKTAAAVAAPAIVSDDNIQKLYQPGSFTVQPVDGMRRTIAARLTQSKQTVPHFYLSVTATLDALMTARESLNASAPRDAAKSPLWRLSINDFVIKALGLALQKVPAANVTWAGDAILQHRVSDVGVAVAVEGGLFTPVVRNVESKTLQCHLHRDEAARRQGPSPQAGALGVSGRHKCRLQSRHVRHRGIHRHHQPAACLDPGGWRGRGAFHAGQWPTGSGHADDLHAVLRSSRRRWRRRCRIAAGLPLVY